MTEVKQPTTQDVADSLQRQAQTAALAKKLVKVLFNRRGIDRLENISDEEWQRAEVQDEKN